MHFGGDYNPEQWPESVWREDVRLMREARVTMVTVGVFSWSRIQPDEGVFDWAWLDAVIDLLHSNGIKVDLATATATPPPWATTKYPEMLPEDENGATYWHGSRQIYAPTSPVYRRLASTLVEALVERYLGHPAVEMWHVNNELGCHIVYDYSDNARDAFRVWLQRKYGTIGSLNRAWNTDFWSQRYGSFEQIVPPRKTPALKNPSQLLDFKRFSSDALLDLFTMERDIIRATGATQPITTNFFGAFPGADYWRWAAELDFISNDSYPDPNDPEAFREAAFAHDLMRSLKPDVPWLMMEQASNAVQWRPSNAPKAPGEMAAWSMQAVSRGADGVLYFQWRQSRGGAEKYHSAMLPHAGTETRVWREVAGLGADLASVPKMGGPSGARVALVFDWESLWALSGPGHMIQLDYNALVQRWYVALHRQHIAVDIVPPTRDLHAYDLVLAPHLYLLTDEGARNLSAYVSAGGHLFVAAFTDVVDENDMFREGGYVQGLCETLGIRMEEYGALVPPGFDGPGEQFVVVETPAGPITGQYLAEEIHPAGADIVGRFSAGRLAGAPALTTHTFGSGRAHYLATIPDDDGMRAITRWACDQASVVPVIPALPDRVEAARCGDTTTIINYQSTPVSVPVQGTDALTGTAVTRVDLLPFGWAIVRTSR